MFCCFLLQALAYFVYVCNSVKLLDFFQKTICYYYYFFFEFLYKSTRGLSLSGQHSALVIVSKLFQYSDQDCVYHVDWSSANRDQLASVSADRNCVVFSPAGLVRRTYVDPVVVVFFVLV